MADQSLDDFLGTKPAPAWRRWVKWGAVAIGVLLLVLLAMKLFGPAKDVDYATVAAERGNLTVTVSATGKLAPTNQVTVGSQLSGLVTKVWLSSSVLIDSSLVYIISRILRYPFFHS